MKLLGGDPNQLRVVTAVPRFGATFGAPFLLTLGVVETLIALWVLSGLWPLICALTQTVLLVALNFNGLIWARRMIHDPAGMVVKNAAFLVLAWVSASHPGWS